MKRYALLSVLLFCLGYLNAQETIHFRTDAPQGLYMKKSNSSSLSLHYSIQELGIANFDNGEVKGQEVILKGQFGPNAEGCPNLPVVNRYIAIPQGATVNLQIKENASTTLHDIDLLPSAPLPTDLYDGKIQLQWNPEIYNKDANYPAENIVLSEPTQIRSLDVVLLSITPFRYNPVRHTLEVIYDIDIDFSFEGGNGQFGESRYFNPDWEHILRNLVINGDILPKTDYYGLMNSLRDDEDGWEYLIITPNDSDALAWADTLKAFRTKQGISTKVVSLSECGGNNTTSIRNYILNAYTNWAIPPAAVLLFGGYYNGEGITPYYHYTITDEYSSRRYPTDYPYSDMNGDSLADVALSRVTARTAEEYQTFVEKTIQYESNPPTDASYYDRPIITSGHEDNKWFMISSQSINGFYRDKLGKHPTDLYMLISSSGAPSDPTWSTGYNVSVLMDYFGPNGQNYIPETMEGLHDWISSNDNSGLHAAINEGSFLTLYRDHSNFNAWWSPSFGNEDVSLLENKYPTFVFSIGCSTTLFTEDGRCLIDAFCTKENGGAVGGIGAASLTHSYYNDILAWGLYDCIWPNFLPDMGSNTPPDFVRPSYALSEAKHYFAYHVFMPGWWIPKEQSTMHLFSYTGETYLNLYTEVPQDLQISHALFYPAGTNQYVVTAEEGTVICLSKEGEIIDVAKSEGQPCTLILPDMGIGEHFTVTATKQNRFRYENEVTIIPESGPYVIVDADGLLIENEYNVLHNGENAQIGIILHNYGNDLAENVTMSLSCESDYIEIIQSSCQTHNLSPGQATTINDAFRFNISDITPDMTEVVLNIRIDDGNGERECDLKQYIAAPMLVIKPEFSFKNESQQTILQIEREGITDIHVQIANEGHFDSDPVNMHLDVLAPFITIDSPTRMFNLIAKGDTKDVLFRINANDSSIEEGWLKTNIYLDDGLHQATLNTLLPFGGFNESFDPSYFNSHNWLMGDDAPWALTDEDSHSDTYSAKSGLITDNQSSSLFITKTTQETEISFYKQVSSEANYDKLFFYIDDEELGQWSGSIPWSEERYPVTQGTHTFKWSYTKDYSVTSGSDCAWIDDINILPSYNTIAYSGGSLKVCEDEDVRIDCNYAYYYQDLAWTTFGDGHFVDNHVLHPVYIPGVQDKANGGTTLFMNVDSEISPLQLILTDNISLGDGIVGDAIVDPQETVFSHYSVEDQDGINYIWQLEPQEAGIVFAHGNVADVVWSFQPNIYEATLMVSADASCSQTLSKSISIDLLSTDEKPVSLFTLYPNPTDGSINLFIEESLQGKAVVEVYNLLGEKMTEKTVGRLPKGGVVSLDLGRFAPGLYIIRINTEKGIYSKKLSLR